MKQNRLNPIAGSHPPHDKGQTFSLRELKEFEKLLEEKLQNN